MRAKDQGRVRARSRAGWLSGLIAAAAFVTSCGVTQGGDEDGDGDGGACHVGVWERPARDDLACTGCYAVDYLLLKDDETWTLLSEVIDCAWASNHLVEVSSVQSDPYRVEGDTFASRPDDDDPSTGNISCAGDTLELLGSLGPLDGSWTRVPAATEDAVRGLFVRDCAGYTHCYGGEATPGACSVDADCVTPPGASEDSFCQDGACWTSCF